MIECNEEMRPKSKEVTRRKINTSELIIRGNIHLFSAFNDLIARPYHVS